MVQNVTGGLSGVVVGVDRLTPASQCVHSRERRQAGAPIYDNDSETARPLARSASEPGRLIHTEQER